MNPSRFGLMPPPRSARSSRPGVRIALEELERRDTPTFAANPPFPFDLPGGVLPHVFTVGDFNGDGHADLAFALSQSTPPLPAGDPGVLILTGDGTGNFSTPQTLDIPIPG